MPIIHARKHNGEISKIFHHMQLVCDRPDVKVYYSAVGSRVDEVRKQSHWHAHYAAYKVFPVGAWYNFVIVEKENGNEYYCNLASPFDAAAQPPSYIDYDIDIIRSPEGEISVHDEEQFAERITQFGYPSDLVERIRQTQQDLNTRLCAKDGYLSTEFYDEIRRLRKMNYGQD